MVKVPGALRLIAAVHHSASLHKIIRPKRKSLVRALALIADRGTCVFSKSVRNGFSAKFCGAKYKMRRNGKRDLRSLPRAYRHKMLPASAGATGAATAFKASSSSLSARRHPLDLQSLPSTSVPTTNHGFSVWLLPPHLAHLEPSHRHQDAQCSPLWHPRRSQHRVRIGFLSCQLPQY